jgi:hypothetical protein
MKAAAQVYSRTDNYHEKMGEPVDSLSPKQALEQFFQSNYWVVQRLCAKSDLSVLDLGFGAPGYARAVSTVARNHRIVDLASRRGTSDAPVEAPCIQAGLTDDFRYSP